jgi:RNA polymerase sigma-70 factor (ECF subfamily)
MSGGRIPDAQADLELMARIQAGDVRAFEMLYARYAHPLLNFFFQMCFDRIAAEDYLQETFLRVWRARHTYRPVGKVSTWLFQIAKNFWFNERAKLKRRPFHAGVGGDESQGRLAQVADAGSDLSPEGAARAGEVAHAIRRAVSGLSEKLRVVFVLGRYRGLPYAEISRILEIPVGTVKSRMALAERTLRARLGKHLEDDA